MACARGPRRRAQDCGTLGRSFSLDNVAVLLGETPARLLPDVEAALGADLLVATPESLTFDRELVWRALAESVPRPARQALHRQIGQLLPDQGGPVTEAARHLVSAGRPASPRPAGPGGQRGPILPGRGPAQPGTRSPPPRR